jgi:CubicO group peptidase (beta-lactamase class C family)
MKMSVVHAAVLRCRLELWLAAGLVPSVVAGQSTSPVMHRVDSIVRAHVELGFSGVVLVAQGDSILLHRAYAPAGERVSTESAFWIASITKGFTAAAVLRLQETGRLSITDSIVRFFPDAPADKRALTIHQLLTHTSGLGGEYTGGGISERSRAVEAILAQELIHQPGAGYKYGNDNYALLAAIIEIASGLPWEDYVQESLVRPTGLQNIGFACRPGARVGRPVERAAQARRRGGPISHVACDWGHKGANGMSATADDLFRWIKAAPGNGPLVYACASVIGRPHVFVRS